MLETDFGDTDPYVGIMKAVIKRINPKAEIIDLTHGIPSFDVMAGAYVLYNSFRYFPPETLFVTVVDPGVGTERLPIIARLCDRYFVAPDNGIVYPVVKGCEKAGTVEIRSIDLNKLSKLMSGITGNTWKISKTFHGRDVFAPAAAMLSRGISPSEIAPEHLDHRKLVPLSLFHHQLHENTICYSRVYIDKFGNIALSVRYRDFKEFFRDREEVILVLADKTYKVRLGKTFSDVGVGELLIYENSFGFTEIGVNQGSARDLLGEHVRFCFIK